MEARSGDVRALLQDALRAYASDPTATAALRAADRRLDEPMRVAIAGMVKAGKSTLLNALLGEEIAPTGAGECTRVVTWYRFGLTPRVTVHRRSGIGARAVNLPVRRSGGRLLLDLGGIPVEEVDRLEVEWPLASLRDLTLIDTPGIASASADVSAAAMRFLTPENAPSAADAVIYLMRHLHASDVGFLSAFRDTAAGRSGLVNAVAVLSRADEVGAGRIDALLSAKIIADRYRKDEQLRRLVLDVLPVAGLLAQSARTLRQDERDAFAELSRHDRAARERLLVSADRFCRDDAPVALTAEARSRLLGRFGMFGIRLGAALQRGGFAGAAELSAELVRRSGLEELRRTVATRFQARAEELKARTALGAVLTLLDERPPQGGERLRAAAERITAGDHGLRELALLGALRTEDRGLQPEVLGEAERLLGCDGVESAVRLRLADDATPGEVRAAAADAVRRWRTRAENPFTDRWTAELCRTVVRSAEAILDPGGASSSVSNRGDGQPVSGRGIGAPSALDGARSAV
ncbi:MAG: GTP-binding protein [Naasia sp.]|nr:GTP-binding protein [Naasia sp.]